MVTVLVSLLLLLERYQTHIQSRVESFRMNEFMSMTPIFPYLYPRILLSITKKSNVTDNTYLVQIIFFTMPDNLLEMRNSV